VRNYSSPGIEIHALFCDGVKTCEYTLSAVQIYYSNTAAFTSHTVLEDAASLGHRNQARGSLSPKGGIL
jgi:hypothetical protein